MNTQPIGLGVGMVTDRKIIMIIVVGLFAVVMSGLGMTFYLITHKADPGLIAVVAGLTGTALGGIMGMLNNTRTEAPPAANQEPIQPGMHEPQLVHVENPREDPVHVESPRDPPLGVDTKPL